MRKCFNIKMAAVLLMACLATITLWAQQPQGPFNQGPGGFGRGQGVPGGLPFGRGRGRGRQEPPKEEPKMPTDPKLLQLHKDFVNKAEKLAGEYERAKDNEKARAVYEEILKLVPKYPPAVEKLAKLRDAEFNAEKKTVAIFANKELQDTGVVVSAGKPVRIEVSGSWTFNMTETLGPDGMDMPDELRNFNLGALFGVIDSGDGSELKPFLVGSQYEFTAEKSGRLMLGMWDSKHSDNAGKLDVVIRGTFEKK